MSKAKAIILSFCFLMISSVAFGQELNCNVTIISDQVQVTNKAIFKDLENSIREFMNTRRWTNDNYDIHERIECNIAITVKEVNGNNYTGSIQIKASRPAYGTTYNSATFMFYDKSVQFDYIQFQRLELQDGVYTTELPAILGYYAYLVIGYDYDSFSELGGTSYLQKAMEIANAAQSSSFPGWSTLEKNEKNRYYMINDILDERFKPIRRAMYAYHIQGLDLMHQDKEEGYEGILKSLRLIEQASQRQPNNLPKNIFFDAKSDELIDLFSSAPSTIKGNARALLSKLDPPNASKYTEGLN